MFTSNLKNYLLHVPPERVTDKRYVHSHPFELQISVLLKLNEFDLNHFSYVLP